MKQRFTLKFHPDILTDLQKAVDYYNEKQVGLGQRFYEAARAQLQALRAEGLYYAIKYDDIRCAKISVFPYFIHYEVDEKQKTVYVHAVICTYRNPDQYWAKREF